MPDEDDEFISDNEIIADHLTETYGLVPFILQDGTLGIHFMEISFSREFSKLIDEMKEIIEGCRDGDGVIRDPENVSDLSQYRDMLMRAASEIDEALAKPSR